MRKFLLRALFFLIPFLYSIYASSQPKAEKDCSTTCFSTDVVSTKKLSGSCTAYEMKISFSGKCAHALSHFSVAVPCGIIHDLWNSENWVQAIGTDPTTGLKGFKIDDIAGFGEGDQNFFTVKFNLCSTSQNCEDQLRCWQPRVAYKTSTCVNYETITLNCKSLKASLQKQDASCFGAEDGSLSVLIESGNEPYTFVWPDNSNGESLTGLSAGNYSVIIRDASGAEVTLEETIEQPEEILLSATSTPASCNGAADGAIDLTVSGGAGGYHYLWNNGAEMEDGATTEDRENLKPGLYTVVVSDKNGCSETVAIFLKDNNSLILKATTTPSTCTNDASGVVDLTVSGGTPSYTYSWSNKETTQDLSAVTSGYYTVVVTDSKDCSATSSFTVSKSVFQVPKIVVQPTCHGDDNGSVTIQESIGGTGPFTYVWSHGATGMELTGLAAGTYSVTVTDATGCSRIVTATISDPSEIVVSSSVSTVSCNVDGLSAIDLTVSGGTSPYTFEWTNGAASEDLESIAGGSYTATITDAHGCSVLKEIVVESQPALWSCSINELAATPLCSSEGNVISTSVQGADSYSWSIQSTDGSWMIVSGTDSPAATFKAGTESTSATFTLTITKDGCTQTCNYSVSACNASDNGGGTDPEGEEPGGEEPGGEEPGGDQNCETCFNTNAKVTSASGDCRTYEMVVNTNGLCRHDLSHWTLAIPCGTVSNYSNSEGWKMVSGNDPTTGLYGLKVDDINAFGKQESSFTVRFTVCENNNGCDLSDWNATVAYKAGQCVGIESIGIDASALTAMVSVYPNPFNDQINFEWSVRKESVKVDIIDQYGNLVSRMINANREGNGYDMTIESSSFARGMYYYRLTMDGKTYSGKITKR